MHTLSIIAVIIAFLVGIYIYLKKVSYTYWKRRGVEYIEPEFYYGNTRQLATRQASLGEQFQQIYREFKRRGVKHGGIYVFFRPVYIPIDLEVLKCILQKDFGNFVNHGMYVNEEVDPLSGNLFNLEDEKWKNLRAKLTPAFSSGKMKMMFQTLVQCSDGLKQVLWDYSTIRDPVDIKDVLARYTTDVIGSCAFGINCNSLKNPDSEFRQFGRNIFGSGFLGRMKQLAIMLIPRNILILLRFKVTRKEIEDFFMGTIRKTVEYRETNQLFRKDFMHLLLQLKNRGKITDDEKIIDKNDDRKPEKSLITINELAAQCFVFFTAGFETSATTMTFALYEMALNEDFQERVRKEVRYVLKKHDNKITYDCITEMVYLDQVINETLRLHPPFPGTPRMCNKSYQIPGTDVVIEAGTRIHIPIYGIHTDPEYYPDPEVFDPERFSDENKAKRPSCAFIPFGEGPRICIGARFGLMQSKVGLVAILRHYRVSLNNKTITPIRQIPGSFIMGVIGGIWLDISSVD